MPAITVAHPNWSLKPIIMHVKKRSPNVIDISVVAEIFDWTVAVAITLGIRKAYGASTIAVKVPESSFRLGTTLAAELRGFPNPEQFLVCAGGRGFINHDHGTGIQPRYRPGCAITERIFWETCASSYRHRVGRSGAISTSRRTSDKGGIVKPWPNAKLHRDPQ